MSLILKLDGIQNRSQVDIDAAKKQSKELMQAMAFAASAKGMQAEWEEALSFKSQVARACKAMSPSTIGEALAAQEQGLLKQFHNIPTISDYLAEYQLLTPFVSAATVMESYAPRAETKAERKERELNELVELARETFQLQQRGFENNKRIRNEQEIENHLEAMRRFEVEKQAAQAQAEPLADAGAKPKQASIKPNSNEFAFSGLLIEPNRKNDWFEVIDEMAKSYFNENGVIPSKAQAWTALYTSPPVGYQITTHEDKNDSYLKMPSAKKRLSRTNFYERWDNYTGK